MDNLDFVLAPNESSIVPFQDLYLGRNGQQVVCRLLRFWDSRNIMRDNHFMGITLLLLDEKNCLIHGFVPATLANQFRPLLREGLIYHIATFDVGRCTKMYKITESPFVIRFADYTTIAPIQPSISIAPMKFLLRNVDHLQALANTNLELPDVVGQIRFFKDLTLTIPPPSNALSCDSELQSKEVTVCLSLWDDAAATFRSHLATGNKLQSVMIVTTVNPKLFGDNLFLNSTSATRFYFDPAIEAIKKFKESLSINGDTSFSRADTAELVNKMETVTISDLNAYISKPAEQVQDASFICKAKVGHVLKRNGWSYIACGHCSRKLDRSGTALRCNKCASSRITGIVRYRVELSVQDDTGDASFVVFDSVMTKLLSKTAATLTVEAIDEEDGDIPQCIKAFEGKTYLFIIRVTPFNFTANHSTFTVTTMTEEAPNEVEIAPALPATEPPPALLATQSPLPPPGPMAGMNLEERSRPMMPPTHEPGQGSGGTAANATTSRKRERE